MFKRLLRPQIIKRFCHSHSKTVFKENKKSVEDLLIEQNKELKDINTHLNRLWESGQDIKMLITCFGLALIFKPTR
jgi:predicted transglutaminase-like cysteine proteinase